MDKLYIVRNDKIRIRVIAPNPAVARFMVKQYFHLNKKERLQVIKPQNKKCRKSKVIEIKEDVCFEEKVAKYLYSLFFNKGD